MTKEPPASPVLSGVVPAQDGSDVDEGRNDSGGMICLLWAGALALLSTLTLRPNPDDLYYVNLSQWVVDHGTFPVRDTIFSDQVFPMASWPPMASYDALMGAFARLMEVPAASLVYVGVPPVATFLAVLSLWRLLRAWRVHLVPVALSIALIFLLLDAGGDYSTPGDLFLTRLWQGKVILLCVMVPILLVHALRHVQHPSWRSSAWLLAGGAAAVGLSTTALFLVPIIAVAGVAPLAVRRPRHALVGFLAMAAYPVTAGVVTVALGGHSADDFDSRRLYRFDPAWFGHDIFLHGPMALVAVAAVLTAPFVIPVAAARLTTGLLNLALGVTFIPGVTQLSYDLIGLGPTLWRVSWAVAIAASVGALGVAACGHPRFGRLWPVPALALATVMLFAGTPIWSARAGVELHRPPHWQRSAGSVATARLVTGALAPGDVVLAPPDLATTIDVMTTRVKTVAPRKYYMDYLSGQPGFHYAARETLMDFVDPPPGATLALTDVARGLDTVEVEAVCVHADRLGALPFLRAQGYHTFVRTANFSCLHR